MNPVQIIEAARPEVGTMPPIERRHLRERIFDAAIRAQSELSPVEVASPNNRVSNAARVAALALLGVAAIGGLAFSASRDTSGAGGNQPPVTDNTTTTSEPERITVIQPPRPTVAPTTTVAAVAGSEETPLLLPPERNRLDQLTVVRSRLGGSALLLRGPDLSTISLVEFDGVAPDDEVDAEPTTAPDDATTTTTAPLRQYGSVVVRPPDEETPGQYELQVECGSVTVLDAEGRAAFRPEIAELFESMQIVDGVITIDLPEGWAAISAGPSTDEFSFGLPVEIEGELVTITMAQYPGGSLAIAAVDQHQYGPATFNGQPAWIHRDVEDPGAFTVLTTVGTTAIQLSAHDISLSAAEAVVNGLTPGDVDEWTNRFGTLPVDVDPDIRACRAQPEFELD